MIDPKDISLIVPVYNVEPYLEACLDSILTSNSFKGEIICIDDGSTDNSPTILAQYATRYPNIRVIRQENAGLSAARNRGMAEATGKYVCFVDSDDVLTPRYVACLCQCIDHEDAVCFGMEWFHDSTGEAFNHWVPQPVRHQAGKAYYENSFNNNVTVCSAAWRREFLLAHGLTFIPGVCYEDENFTPKALYYAQDVTAVTEILYRYRHRPCSTTTSPYTPHHHNSLMLVTADLYAFLQDKQWLAEPCRHNIYNLYWAAITRATESSAVHFPRMPRAHWKALMQCTPPDVYDYRSSYLARFSTRLAKKYHDYTLNRTLRKLLNAMLRLREARLAIGGHFAL